MSQTETEGSPEVNDAQHSVPTEYGRKHKITKQNKNMCMFKIFWGLHLDFMEKLWSN